MPLEASGLCFLFFLVLRAQTLVVALASRDLEGLEGLSPPLPPYWSLLPAAWLPVLKAEL